MAHKLWPFQNGMFSITEIGKNRKNQNFQIKEIPFDIFDEWLAVLIPLKSSLKFGQEYISEIGRKPPYIRWTSTGYWKTQYYCNLIKSSNKINFNLISGHKTQTSEIGQKMRPKSKSLRLVFNLTKVGCVSPMVVVSIVPHAEFGPNDHMEDAPYFIYR